jgi:glycerol uptake facilitator-like aquaporin
MFSFRIALLTVFSHLFYFITSLGFGIGVFIGVQVCGPVSGAHLNPAVSVGLVVTRRCPILRAVVYIVAQCAGATSKTDDETHIMNV